MIPNHDLLDLDPVPRIQKYSLYALRCFIICAAMYLLCFIITVFGFDGIFTSLIVIMGFLIIVGIPINLTGAVLSIYSLKEQNTPTKIIALLGNGAILAFNLLVIYFMFAGQ